MIAITSRRQSSGAKAERLDKVWRGTQALPSDKKTRRSSTYVFLRKGADLCVGCETWPLCGCDSDAGVSEPAWVGR